MTISQSRNQELLLRAEKQIVALWVVVGVALLAFGALLGVTFWKLSQMGITPRLPEAGSGGVMSANDIIRRNAKCVRDLLDAAAEIERLRAALDKIIGVSLGRADFPAALVHRIAHEALRGVGNAPHDAGVISPVPRTRADSREETNMAQHDKAAWDKIMQAKDNPQQLQQALADADIDQATIDKINAAAKNPGQLQQVLNEARTKSEQQGGQQQSR